MAADPSPEAVKALEAKLLDAAITGPRNIPKALFLKDLGGFLNEHDPTVVLKCLSVLHSRFSLMTQSLAAQKTSLESKVPDIDAALEAVRLLQDNKQKTSNSVPIRVRYVLSENAFASAEIAPETDKVYLWLGAKTMLEYPIAEALDLLLGNRKAAIAGIEELNDALLFLRGQCTTVEVNSARIHNYVVESRQTK